MMGLPFGELRIADFGLRNCRRQWRQSGCDWSAGRWLLGLGLVCLISCGCGPRESAHAPSPAYEVANAYPPLEGKLAEKMASGEVRDLVNSGKLK